MSALDVDLVPLRPEDADAMFVCLADRTAYRFVPDEPPESISTLRELYRRLGVGHSANGDEIWCNWMIRDAVSGQAMGFTQATIKAGCALIAYHLAPLYWRQGIGTRVVFKTARLLFARDDVDRLRALVDTRNVASAGLLRKIGFVRIAHHPRADFFKGESSDEFEFELTRAAWEGLQDGV